MDIIYVVDDDQLFRWMAEKMLRHQNPDVELRLFPDGSDALQALQAGEDVPQIIFLDINMVHMNGWQFLEALQQLNMEQRPRIYLLSSSIDPGDRARARSTPGVTGFLSKPLTSAMLADIFQPA